MHASVDSVRATLSPCQPRPCVTPSLGAVVTFDQTFRPVGPGLYEIKSRTRPDCTHVYDAVEDRCSCEARQSCWHRDAYLTLTSDMDRATALVAGSIQPPIESAIDPMLRTAAMDDSANAADGAQDPPHCARKNLDGQCRRAPDPLYGQGIFCIGHASEAYQLGLLTWADVERKPTRPAEVAS